MRVTVGCSTLLERVMLTMMSLLLSAWKKTEDNCLGPAGAYLL